jgi:hypothetical protein
MFWFYLRISFETFLILRRLQHDIIISVCKCSCSVPVGSCQISMKLEFSQQIFEKKKNSYTEFNEDPSSGSRVVSCGRSDTDKRTDMTKLIVAFSNLRRQLKNTIMTQSINFPRFSQNVGYIYT